ncbi:hypothetical protein BGZ52_002517 [Haplosporangium bisporale]|nr:hypothetical protein BGZ52_002517 [Haplosporangium bisporale]
MGMDMASPTSRAISRLGIGSYRLALGVPEHEKILYKALERQSNPQLNINLIDTSSNYSNGRSEQLIGKGVPANEIVKYSRECYHCIHPEFMRDQLTRSLERLNTKFADILFIHNPEYFLMSTVRDVKDIEVNVKKHQNILLERLATLFEALEREIEKGRIRAYGISSNSFSLKPSNAHFLPYEGLVKMAAAAFEKVRGQKQQEHDRYKENLQLLEKERAVSAATEETNTIKPPSPSSKATSTSTSKSHHMKHPTAPQPTKRTTHGLGFLQMPGNLLEMEGVLRTAKWAKGQGLRVFINRPLNAMSPEYGAVRLASYPEPQSPTYEQAHRHLLDTLSTLSHHRAYLAPNMQRLTEDIEELDSTLKANNLSAIHLEGASIRNQLHQELSKRIKHKPGVSTSATVPQPEGEVSERLSQPIVKETHPSPPSTSTTPSPSSSHMASDHELEGVIKLMDKYIHAFQQQVRFQETGRVSAMLAERGIDLEGESIEQFAIEYLLEHEQVDAVLLGMKREPYVDFARKTLQRLAQGSSSS